MSAKPTQPGQPPELHNIDAERAVLGSLLIDPSAWSTVGPLLTAADFDDPRNKAIFAAIAETARNSKIDYLAICDQLERTEDLERVGGVAALVELLEVVPSAFRVREYAAIVRDYAMRRTLLTAASQIAVKAYDTETPAADVQSKAESIVLACRRDIQEHRQSARDAAALAIDAMYQKDTITTGLPGLDQVLGGLHPGVYIVAARPSMGKSSLLCQMMSGLAENGRRSVLFTIEMSATQVTERMAASLARVPLHAIKQGKTTPEQLGLYSDALGEISEWPLTIIDKSDVRAGDVLGEAHRQMIEFGKLDAIFVDGLWLMQSAQRHVNRLGEVGEISRDMKRVQRETGLPVVMAHQLSRACETRGGDKRPILSDLRETGDVEQDADVVLMMFREGYYNPKHPEANVMELWIRKNRLDGPAGEVVQFFWNGPAMRCEPLEWRKP